MYNEYPKSKITYLFVNSYFSLISVSNNKSS